MLGIRAEPVILKLGNTHKFLLNANKCRFGQFVANNKPSAHPECEPMLMLLNESNVMLEERNGDNTRNAAGILWNNLPITTRKSEP